MTPQDVITEARYILSDTDPVGAGFRMVDDELLVYVNGAISECAILQPALFSTIAQHTCTVSQCEQTIDYEDAVALFEVLCISGGAALTPFDMMTMNAFNPGWRADTAGAARQWCKFANDPRKFFIYPRAPASPQILDIRYVKEPTTFGLNDTITDVPPALKTALVDYVAFRAQSKDSEYANNPSASPFYQAFLAKLKG